MTETPESPGAPETPTGPGGGATPPAPPPTQPPAPPAASPSAYPVSYEADYAEERDRLTTFFRLLLAIPWLLLEIVYGIGALVVTIIAWFALIFTGRYPNSLFDFNLGFLRYSIRVASWLGLQTDEWPPWGFAERPDYPVRLHVERAERQSRLKVLFRLILGIPAALMAAVIGGIAAAAAIVSWFAIVFRGYQPRRAHDAFTYAYTFQTRFHAYFGWSFSYGGYGSFTPIGGLLTDAYPPLGDDGWRRAQERKQSAA